MENNLIHFAILDMYWKFERIPNKKIEYSKLVFSFAILKLVIYYANINSDVNYIYVRNCLELWPKAWKQLFLPVLRCILIFKMYSRFVTIRRWIVAFLNDNVSMNVCGTALWVPPFLFKVCKYCETSQYSIFGAK